MEKLNELYSKEEIYSPNIIETTLEPYEAVLEITGNLFNKSIYNFKNGEIGIVLCDKNQRYLGFAKTFVSDIYSNQRKDFQLRFFQQLPKEVNVCDEVININILEEANVLK
jgi:hypothetical protein